MDQGCSLVLAIQPGERPGLQVEDRGQETGRHPTRPHFITRSAVAPPKRSPIEQPPVGCPPALSAGSLASYGSKRPDGPAGQPCLSDPCSRSSSALSPAWAPLSERPHACCLTLLLSPQAAFLPLQSEPGHPGLSRPSRPCNSSWLCCPHGQLAREYSSRTHGGQHRVSRLCYAKLGNKKQLPPSVTSTHQRRDIIGQKPAGT